jgi:hypothetical protein
MNGVDIMANATMWKTTAAGISIAGLAVLGTVAASPSQADSGSWVNGSVTIRNDTGVPLKLDESRIGAYQFQWTSMVDRNLNPGETDTIKYKVDAYIAGSSNDGVNFDDQADLFFTDTAGNSYRINWKGFAGNSMEYGAFERAMLKDMGSGTSGVVFRTAVNNEPLKTVAVAQFTGYASQAYLTDMGTVSLKAASAPKPPPRR